LNKMKETISSGFGVVFQPRTYQGMLSGAARLASAIRPTLGPLPRMVALTKSDGGTELLDDGGLIARRLIQLPDRDEDVGAMYLRHLLWRMREDCGDGTATTAVLFDEILKLGVRHIVNGGNAVLLRNGLEKGARLVYAELEKMTRPFLGHRMLTHIAQSICYDESMAKMLGEIFDTIGEYGHFELRAGRGRGLDYEYTAGSYWEGPIHSKLMINRPAENRAVLEDTGVLVTDFAIEEINHLVRPIVEARKAGKTSLLLICNAINDECIGFLMSEQTRKVLPVIAVKTPSVRIEEQMGAMEDIAILTGGKQMTLHAGETLESVTPAHYGQARLAWANNQHFGLQGGQGDPRAIRRHFWSLKKLHAGMENSDSREIVRTRIGKLMGGSAILFTGGATEMEINTRKDLAERAAEAIRGAMMHGVIPGGGSSYLACRPALKTALEEALDPEEKAAYRILLTAMEIPLRTIAANAGLVPEEVFAELKQAGPGFGYDVRKRRTFDIGQAELIDSASVVQAAAYRAIMGAALLLTVDVLVHLKKPEAILDT
jgi:chaperonin GroEL